METRQAAAPSAAGTTLSRRGFILGAAATAALAIVRPEAVRGAEANSRIEIGIVGHGGRGGWIAKLFKKHGGYQFTAIADYFPQVAQAGGEALGVEKARRFSGLSGYRKLIESKVQAVLLQTPPYFFPEHAAAAVAAGCHVYMAKPVAVDVPGALAIETAGKRAAEQKRCFLVDYQMPTDPVNIEVAKRVREGGIGPLAQVVTTGICGGFGDPPRTATLESRLQRLVWVNDVALGCDYIGNYDIHALDAAVWVLGKRPVAALGASRICRANPNGDGRDVCSVVYDYADGLVHNHFGQALKNNTDGELSVRLYGQAANALLNYWGKAFVRGGPQHYPGGPVESLYEAGAGRNIAAFHQAVTQGRCENETVRRAVDGVLTCILGREAAARRTRLSMDELLKENRRLEVDLKGLQA